jgi:hypothetical protein
MKKFKTQMRKEVGLAFNHLDFNCRCEAGEAS